MTFLRAPLTWLALGWLGLAVIVVLFLFNEFRNREGLSQKTPWIARIWPLALMLVLLVGRRLPLLFYNQEINPDESQILSQAITLWHYPVYWQSTDGATMGPLSSYVSAVPAFLGFPLDYLSGRWVGFLCLLVSVVAGYFTLLNLFDLRVARLGILPMVVFLAFSQHPDFVHSTNEQLSLALLGLGFWQFSRVIRGGISQEIRAFFWLGFICSLVPFAKLQGTPSALVLVGAAATELFFQRASITAATFGKALLALIAGGLVFPLFFISCTLLFGVFDDFVQFYLLANAGYGTGNGFIGNLGKFPAFLGRTTDFSVYILIPGAWLLVSWLLFSRQWQQRKRLLIYSGLILAASLYAVVKPGNEFTHYLLYLVFPLSLLYGWLVYQTPSPWLAAGLLVLISGSVIGNVWATYRHDKRYNLYISTPTLNRQTPQSKVSQTIAQYASDGERLVVWGWMPRYNVETQMPQGVCDNHTIRLVFGSVAEKHVHQTRYLRNIRASRPPVFVDSVGENCVWLNDRATQAHEVIPELNAYITANYTFVGEVEYTRIYVRNDRIGGRTAQTGSGI
ncbi:MAG: hypothetical protein LH606_03680 [Cytophagaceae bacterium]|nr:hypothetical protein [Cytophagaceae bacterium]